MTPRLLIINCSSPYFFYIPMGTFGLCDYLGQRDIAARIFNPSLYCAGEVQGQLLAALTSFQPTHVGFVLHWQETAHGLLEALEAVTAWNPEVVTLCGGFTAAYFAEDILETVEGLQYVIIGDPEEPIYQLLQGNAPASIANLVRRAPNGTGAAVRNENWWLMEQPLLDSLSFAGLHFLIDADRYLEKINTKLGFPIFLGRGCVFDCEYCGGSRSAFHLHSHRHKPVSRSVPAILADLHALKDQTRLLYICYENDPAFVTALFRAIAEDQDLKGYFTLHYGAWHLLDRQFLECYRDAFNCSVPSPLFEFSPEVFSDTSRAEIKRGSVYTMEQLRDNIKEIGQAFNGRVRIEVFFSRYHPLITAEMLMQEIRDIYLLKHELFLQGSMSVRICFDHLSTDVGSHYWQRSIENPRIFSTLLRLKLGIDEGTLHPFPVDNLCVFIPDHLPQDFQLQVEAMLLVLEKLERHCLELFHILFACLGDQWLRDLIEILAPYLVDEGGDTFFDSPPLDALLGDLGRRFSGNPISAAALPFLSDLIRFTRKKIDHAFRPVMYQELPTITDNFVINLEHVGIHEHDYLDLVPFINRLQQCNVIPLAYQRTVCLFLSSGIVTMPHAVYRSTLKHFEQPVTLAHYYDHIRGLKGIDADQLGMFLNRLIKGGLLLPVSEPMTTVSCRFRTDTV